jgi:2',3'-cyclic-nucleotide 2'-phosphodiesterase (5'-nucleotidase family)
LGDWIADCERAWAGADLALISGGSLRADLAEGPVTLRGLFDVMPFNNRAVTLVMTGRNLRQALEHGAGGSRWAQISGAEESFHSEASEGKRLASVSVAGRALVAESTYSVATIDYLAGGGDGYAAFELAQSSRDAKTPLFDVLKECALKKPRIKAPRGGRLVPLDD